MGYLDDLLATTAAGFPSRRCLIEQGGTTASYEQLNVRAEAIAAALRKIGVRPGDRVGICAPKSIATVAAIFGVLRAGAAYVPVDPSAPMPRSAGIFADCQVRAILVVADLAEPLTGSMADLHPVAVRSAIDAFACLTATGECVQSGAEISYILYTSGSTGKPKGVVHTHASARAFVDWCSAEFAPQPEDCFSAHAPFHFDLSILDLFVPIKHGASIRIIGADEGKQPAALVDLLAKGQLTFWYSTPTVLRSMMEYGGLADRDIPGLRIICFAGEVFPIKHLKALAAILSRPAYYNLFGPTETNVCTYFRFGDIAALDDRADVPIGFASSDDELMICDPDFRKVAVGEPGELFVTGGSVMTGYWGLPQRNAVSFADIDGQRWYRTGEIVLLRADGALLYRGRADRMVKRRGHRIELGEIEAAMLRHPDIVQGAAVAVPDPSGDMQIVFFHRWSGSGAPSAIILKRHASQQLPMSMIPDRFQALAELPMTSTDKIDFQKLQDAARGLFANR